MIFATTGPATAPLFCLIRDTIQQLGTGIDSVINLYLLKKQSLLRKFTGILHFILFVCYPASAQDISFFHLNTTDGLSDNFVTSVARDRSGLLWIATAEGLNSFDGYKVKRSEERRVGKEC